MALGLSASMTFNASRGSVGIPSTFTMSFPVPKGSMPITVSVPTRPDATSFTVPSPPTAIMYFSPCSAAALASSLPWPLHWVNSKV